MKASDAQVAAVKKALKACTPYAMVNNAKGLCYIVTKADQCTDALEDLGRQLMKLQRGFGSIEGNDKLEYIVTSRIEVTNCDDIDRLLMENARGHAHMDKKLNNVSAGSFLAEALEFGTPRLQTKVIRRFSQLDGEGQEPAGVLR